MLNNCIKQLLIWLFVFCGITAQAQLGENAQISLLTCSPSDRDVYTLFGHTALRVRNVIQKDSVSEQVTDLVFNYGLFHFSKPNFIYRFAKGETDYMLGVCGFDDFLTEYQMRGSEVYEQVLNLDYEEKNALWQALIVNAQPENRVYRYNFFFDNCATRPVVLTEKAVNGHVAYSDHLTPETFREMINYCMRYHPWVTFGCDLVLGGPADRVTTVHESFFIPDHLRKAFDDAWIIRPDGSKQKLVAVGHILAEETLSVEETEKTVFTPLICFSLLFVVILLLSLIERTKKTYFYWLDCLLFFVAGIAGCVLFFLSFISEHPAMWPNISIVWLHPLHLFGVLLFAVKKLNKAAYCYHFINFVALLLVLPVWFFIPQHLNMAFIPLIATLWLRSACYIIRKNR